MNARKIVHFMVYNIGIYAEKISCCRDLGEKCEIMSTDSKEVANESSAMVFTN